jgi:hypothetical protein
MVARTRHNVSTLSCFSLWPLVFVLSRVRKQLCCTYALLRLEGLTSSCIADWQIPPSYKGVPCFFLQPKNASVFAEEWWHFLLQSSIFAATFSRFVRRRLSTHAHSLHRLLCAGGGWEEITELQRSPVNMIIFENIQYTFECIGRYLFELRRFALYPNYIIFNNMNCEYRHL